MKHATTPMHRATAAIGLCGLLTTGLLPSANAALLVDNLTEPTRATTMVKPDFWATQSFVTAGDAVWLDSVTLLLGEGSQSGSASAELRADAGGVPGAWLASLPLPALSGGPTQAETLSPALPTPLAPLTTYWLVLGASTAGDSFGWSYAQGNAFGGPGAFGNYAFSTDTGRSWHGLNTDDPFKLRIEVSPVPEPATAAMFLMGGLLLLGLQRAQRGRSLS
jgi:hypothetical protein